MKSVVLLSGGLDSATCLQLEVEAHGKENVKAITFDYGQKHSNELDSARRVADYIGVELVVAEVDPKIFKGSSSSLLKGKKDIKHLSYEEEILEKGVAETYVPFRNGLMLSQAAALAYNEDENTYVVYGAHSDDSIGSAYPDCSPAFYDNMASAIEAGTNNAVEFIAPFINATKADIVKAGLGVGVPYGLTRSCYEGREKACGTCGTCIDRIRAFKKNNAIDPIEYEVEINWGDAQQNQMPLHEKAKRIKRAEGREFVDSPDHYNVGDIETIDLIEEFLTEEEYRGYLKGNVIKYRERAEHKGKAKLDYAKAKKHWDWLRALK